MRLEITLKKCGTCKGSGEVPYNRYNNEYSKCPTCLGSGKDYPAELIARLEEAAINAFGRRFTGSKLVVRAILDALADQVGEPG